VKYKRGEKNNTSDPNTSTVKHVVKEVSVFIERFSSYVHEKVTAKMASKETDEDETSDGHYEFFADGGAPETA
jgi:hypothetical protein